MRTNRGRTKNELLTRQNLSIAARARGTDQERASRTAEQSADLQLFFRRAAAFLEVERARKDQVRVGPARHDRNRGFPRWQTSWSYAHAESRAASGCRWDRSSRGSPSHNLHRNQKRNRCPIRGHSTRSHQPGLRSPPRSPARLARCPLAASSGAPARRHEASRAGGPTCWRDTDGRLCETPGKRRLPIGPGQV